MRRLAAAVGASLALVAPFAAAQDTVAPSGTLSLGQPQSTLLTIDTEALFAQSLFGQRISATLRADTDALAAENRRIEAALTAEEQSLTDRRPTMDVGLFRTEAEAFDEKVQAIRQAQDAKERALQEASNTGREAFLDAVSPVLAQLLRDSGAMVMLDRRTVIISVAMVDVTDEAVAAIDAGIGEGLGLWPPAADPAEAPAP